MVKKIEQAMEETAMYIAKAAIRLQNSMKCVELFNDDSSHEFVAEDKELLNKHLKHYKKLEKLALEFGYVELL